MAEVDTHENDHDNNHDDDDDDDDEYGISALVTFFHIRPRPHTIF